MRTLTFIGVVVLVTAAAVLSFGQQSGSLIIKDGKDVVEGAQVFVHTNDGPQALGTTGTTGALAGIDPSWFTVKPQGDVIVRECAQGTEVYLNTSDDSAEETCKKISDENGNERDCECRRAGAFVWSQNMALQIGSTFPWPWVVGGAGGALGVFALSNGDDSPQPTTTSPSPTITTSPDIPPTITFTSQYNAQFQFTDGSMELYMAVGPLASMIEATVNGSSITVRGLGNHSWVTVTGNYTSSTGAFTATGMGNFGDFQNVPFTFTGTATESGPISGTLKAGPGGNLPAGVFVEWRVSGQKK